MDKVPLVQYCSVCCVLRLMTTWTAVCSSFRLRNKGSVLLFNPEFAVLKTSFWFPGCFDGGCILSELSFVSWLMWVQSAASVEPSSSLWMLWSCLILAVAVSSPAVFYSSCCCWCFTQTGCRSNMRNECSVWKSIKSQYWGSIRRTCSSCVSVVTCLCWDWALNSLMMMAMILMMFGIVLKSCGELQVAALHPDHDSEKVCVFSIFPPAILWAD